MISSPQEYAVVFNQAEQLRLQGKVAPAQARYRGLLAYWLDREQKEPGLPFTINEFYIIDRLADLSLLTGNKEAARHFLSALSLKTQSTGNGGMRVYAVTKLVFVFLQEGLPDKALECLAQLADLTGSLENIRLTNDGLLAWEAFIPFENSLSWQDRMDQLVCLYDALGALLLALGRIKDGLLLFKRGIELGISYPSPVVDSRLQSLKIFRAKAFFQLGELTEAKAALAGLREEEGPAGMVSGTAVHLLELRSRISLAQGEMGEAYDLLIQLIELCRKYRLQLAEIRAGFNLAQVKILLNQVEEATSILEDSLDQAEQLGETGLAFRISQFLEVTSGREKAFFSPLNYSSLREGPPPVNRDKSSISNPSPGYTRPEDFLSFFDAKALLIQLCLARNDIGKAGELLTALRLVLSSCDSELVRARFSVLEFMVLFYGKSIIPQNWPYQEPLDFLTSNQLLPELWQFRNMLGHSGLISAREREAWITENQRLLDQVTGSLPPLMQTLYLLNKWSGNEEYLAAYSDGLLRLKRQSEQGLFIHRWLGQFRLIRGLTNFREKTDQYKDHLLRQVASGAKSLHYVFPNISGGMWKKLFAQPRNRLTISYLVLPDRLVIISRSYLKMHLHVTFVSRVLLRRLIFSLRDHLYPEGVSRGFGGSSFKSSTTPTAGLNTSLEELEKILQLDTLLSVHRRDIRELTFLADDVLHGLPFSLLNAEGMPLAESYRVSISVQEHPRKTELFSMQGKQVLLVGVSGGYAGLEDLPGVASEITQVAELLRKAGAQCKKILNDDVKLRSIESRLKTVQAIHFSGHGKFNYRHPDQSGLVLAEGEMLTLKSILALGDLSALNLVVLSSCRGAEHYILPGRWIIGLPETFCRAGVHIVLAFLWPVEDRFAVAFCVQFYSYLCGRQPAEAFRLAILDAQHGALNIGGMDYTAPRHWAGAILYER